MCPNQITINDGVREMQSARGRHEWKMQENWAEMRKRKQQANVLKTYAGTKGLISMCVASQEDSNPETHIRIESQKVRKIMRQAERNEIYIAGWNHNN